MNENIKKTPQSFIRTSSRNNVVKVSFYPLKELDDECLRIKLSIGCDIARDLKWKDGDHLNIEGDRMSLCLSKVVPCDDPEYKTFKGYKFKKILNSYSYSVSFASFFIPEIRNIKTVPHEIIDHMNDVKYLKIFLEMIK